MSVLRGCWAVERRPPYSRPGLPTDCRFQQRGLRDLWCRLSDRPLIRGQSPYSVSRMVRGVTSAATYFSMGETSQMALCWPIGCGRCDTLGHTLHNPSLSKVSRVHGFVNTVSRFTTLFVTLRGFFDACVYEQARAYGYRCTILETIYRKGILYVILHVNLFMDIAGVGRTGSHGRVHVLWLGTTSRVNA